MKDDEARALLQRWADDVVWGSGRAIDVLLDDTRAFLATPAAPAAGGSPLGRDADWTLAIADALGVDSGYFVPIAPDPAAFRKLFAAVRAAAPAAPAEPVARRILLDVVPGWDGMGEEVYGYACERTEARLKRLTDRVDELERAAPPPEAEDAAREDALRYAASRIRNATHTCMTEKHCEFLHAAHERVAQELEAEANAARRAQEAGK